VNKKREDEEKIYLSFLPYFLGASFIFTFQKGHKYVHLP